MTADARAPGVPPRDRALFLDGSKSALLAAAARRDGLLGGGGGSSKGASASSRTAAPAHRRAAAAEADAVVRLINCTLGAGILGFPHAYRQTGVALASILVIVAALASRAGLRLLLLCAARVGGQGAALSYRSLATAALGPAGGAAVTASAAALHLGCLVACLNALADVGSSVAGGLVPPGAEPARGALLAVAAAGAALPAAFLLGGRPGGGGGVPPASAAVGRFSVAAVAALAGCLALFAADDAVARRAGGSLHPPPPPPTAEPLRLWRPAGVPTAAPLMAYAFAAHPFLFGALSGSAGASTAAQPPPSTAALRRAVSVVRAATAAAAAAYVGVGLAGYAAFRGRTAGDILRNLSGGGVRAGSGDRPVVVGFLAPPARRAIAAAVKAAVALSLLGTVPLLLAPVRAAAVGAVGRSSEDEGRPGSGDVEAVGGALRARAPAPTAAWKGGKPRPSAAASLADAAATTTALAAATAAAALLPSVDLVLGLAGGSAAAALGHVLPAACFLRLHAASPSPSVFGAAAAGPAVPTAVPGPALPPLAPHAASAALRLSGGEALKSPTRPPGAAAGRAALLFRVSGSGDAGPGARWALPPPPPAAPAPRRRPACAAAPPAGHRGDRARSWALLFLGLALAVSGTAATARAAASAADVAAAATALAKARSGVAAAAAAVGAMAGGGGRASASAPVAPTAAVAAAAAANEAVDAAARVLEKADPAVVEEAGPIAAELEREAAAGVTGARAG